MALTDNEIIKALECCKKDDCDNCPNDFGNCYANLAGYALDLINRQKAEKEALIAGQETLQKHIAEQKAEIERLKQTPKCVYTYDGETMEYCVEGPCSVEKLVDEIKAEAIKEFAERMKLQA